MAEAPTKQTEREYVIPLRREWQKVARYKRTSRSIRAIKNFIAKHMRVPDRDTKKVKLDIYLNNEIWSRGTKKPPTKIRVKAIKKGDIIEVTLIKEPDYLKYVKARHDKRHSKVTKKREEKPEGKGDEKKVEEKVSETEVEKKTEEKKPEEKEKVVKTILQKPSERAKKIDKLAVKPQKTQQTFRKALKK